MSTGEGRDKDRSAHQSNMTRAEAAKHMRVSEKTLMRMEKSGKLRGMRFGRRVLYTHEMLAAAITDPEEFKTT